MLKVSGSENLEPVEKKLRWGPEQRLEFVEFLLFWEGALNRSAITERFGVSVPQASNDLAAYRELAPENLEYDASAKRYVATATFRPRFLKPNPDRFLAQLKALSDGIIDITDTWFAGLPQTGVLPVPSRRIDALVLRTILAAIRERRGIRVEYQSMSPDHPDPLWRWITPHALGFDGLRWHVRAYCHRNGQFLDFILGRCLAVGELGEPAANATDDWQWLTFFDVLLEPNPELTEGQRRAVALDYGMTGGKLTVQVRLALLYYFNKRLRLDVADRLDSPRERPVIVANRQEFDRALAQVTAHTPSSPNDAENSPS